MVSTHPPRYGHNAAGAVQQRKVKAMADKAVNPPVPEEDEWETVAEARSKMLFDTDGDVYVGIWEGFEDIIDPNTSEVYRYANFRDDDNGPVTTSAGYQLERALKEVPTGKRVKITRTGSTDMGKGKNPMTDFKVQVSKKS